jgi:hypothetical protein
MALFRQQNPSPADKLAEADLVSLEYLGRMQLAVSGTVTGKLYRFSPTQTIQAVDVRDAFELLNSGLFGIAL